MYVLVCTLVRPINVDYIILIYEVVDNSVDEVMAGFADLVTVVIHADDFVTIEDNGRGIPVDEHHQRPGMSTLEVVMTVLHAGGKFGGGGYQISSGLHGVGVSVVNALSEWCQVDVKHNGTIYRQRYEKGFPVTPLRRSARLRVLVRRRLSWRSVGDGDT